MKVIAFYLPQYHEIKENNEWWGKGFTEWTNVRNSKPYFKGHNMPRRPLNDNYYDLTDVKTMLWQKDLAKKYGIYGFAYYHYWFEGEMLLEKPAEIMLQHPEVDMPFCFSWANHTWSRIWADKTNNILKLQKYGDEKDWKCHFDYLLPFFKDKRYIKENGRPVMIIYNPLGVKEFPEMMRKWQQWAKDAGLPGIFFLHQQNEYDHHKEPGGDLFEGGIEFQPNRAVVEYIRKSLTFKLEALGSRIADKIPVLVNKYTMKHYGYDDIWKIILKQQPKGNDWYPGAFADWDNTPRRKNKGVFCDGTSPEKFEYYLTQQIKRARDIYHKDYLFMFAWNEWGESGYLEPDTKNGYKMLEAMRKALMANDEFPDFNK